MTEKVQELFEALPERGCIEDLGIVIEKIRDIYALDHVVYHALSLGAADQALKQNGTGALKRDSGLWLRDPEAFVTFTYSSEWGKRYLEADYRRIDPVVEGAISGFMPLDWKALPWDTKKRRQMRFESVECGLGNQGCTIPIRGPDGQFAIFTVNKSCSDEEWERYLGEYKGEMMIVAHFFHQKVLEIESVFGSPQPIKLSDRERDALSYIAAGRSRAQAADKLQISENTLRVYLDTARHKLGALNLPHAIALAVRKGFLKNM
jgi:DNA-binding CsgD family transcriptional regulator